MNNFSVVVTCYNRENVVLDSIQSALDTGGEVVVVDDASSDNSFFLVKRTFSDQIKKGSLKLVRNKKNLGVTGSKNIGFNTASKDYVGFLDSDDVLTQASWGLMQSEILEFRDCGIFFFRCKDQNGKYVGQRIHSSRRIDLRFFLKNTTQGEVFTVINKRVIKKAPYYAYFRGYEGIGCAEILSKAPGLLSKEVVRVYNQQGQDRLSSRHIYAKRRKQINEGHAIMLKKYSRYMSPITRFKYKLKIFLHAIGIV